MRMLTKKEASTLVEYIDGYLEDDDEMFEIIASLCLPSDCDSHLFRGESLSSEQYSELLRGGSVKCSGISWTTDLEAAVYFVNVNKHAVGVVWKIIGPTHSLSIEKILDNPENLKILTENGLTEELIDLIKFEKEVILKKNLILNTSSLLRVFRGDLQGD